MGWRVSSTTVGRLLHRLGYRLATDRGGFPGMVEGFRCIPQPIVNQQFG